MSLSFPDYIDSETYPENDFLKKIEQQSAFVLAESVLNERVPDIAAQYGDDTLTRLYWGDMADNNPFISPYCFPVTRDNWPQLKSLLMVQEGWGLVVFLAPSLSDFTRDEQQLALIRHLREWTLVSLPDGNNQTFRMSDFLVMQHLLSASTLQQTQALLGPIAQFAYTLVDAEKNDESAEFQSLSLVHKDPKFTPVHRSPQEFSEQQHTALSQIVVNTHHQQYQAHLNSQHAETLHWSDEKMREFIEQQTNVAMAYGFNNSQDKVRFLSLSVIFGDVFVNEPWAQTVLKNDVVKGSESKMDKLYKVALGELG